jgi:hypothetical protein
MMGMGAGEVEWPWGGRAAIVDLWLPIAGAAGLVATVGLHKGVRTRSESFLESQWWNAPANGLG